MTGGETGRATSGLGPDLIAQRGFMVVRRGFDQEEVRAFLDQVAAEVRALDRRVAALTDELAAAKAAAARAADAAPVAPAEAVTAAPAERAPLDLDEVVALVGEETASVLRAARSAAVDLRRRAEAEAERIVGDARQASSSMRLEAEGLLVKTAADAEATVEQSRQAARTEADAIVARARADADAVREQAEQERRRTVDGAQAVREKILADLSRRRRVATVQIEQLRAGRERLLESYAVVRRTLDEVHEELQRADTEARAAADEAGRRAEADEPGDGGEPHGASPTSPPGEGAVTPAAAPSTPAVPEPGAGPDEASPAGATSEGGAAGDPGSAGQAGPVTAASADVERVRVLRGDNGAAALRARGDVGSPPALRAVEGGRVAAGGGSAVRILAPEVPQVHEAPHPPDTAAEPGVAAEPDAPGRAEAVRSDADEAALQARDRLVADAEASLVKRLKRLLQDEQNELLDRLRNAGGAPTAAAVLPDEAEQRAALVAAVAPTLTDTAGDGALAIHGGDVGADVASPVAEGLAAAVLDPLRRRLGEAVRSAAGEEQAVLVEAIGSVYREWKTQRVEPAVLDAVVAAFAAGAYAAVPAGTPLRWVVEDTAGPCPDCDDNALAGALGRGEEWPTGQLHPPAHAGCRCLLVRAEQP